MVDGLFRGSPETQLTMSYNQDVYSRRPTDDDRRVPDHRDRRRDSLPRALPDAFREDRYRRDTATSTSTKGRRNPAESPRDQPSIAKLAKPHTNADVTSGRPDHGLRAGEFQLPPAATLFLLFAFAACIMSPY